MSLIVLLTACSTSETEVDKQVAIELQSKDSALCQGLRVPIEVNSDSLLVLGEVLEEHKENTPPEVFRQGEQVILDSSTVIIGYDSICRS